jgi:hypothetical protein
MAEGGLQATSEVEIVLSEDELARVCWYCEAIETETDAKEGDRFIPCGGDGYETTYMCSQVRLNISIPLERELMLLVSVLRDQC